MVHRRGRQQRRHRNARRRHRAIRQDQDVVAVQHRVRRLGADAIERARPSPRRPRRPARWRRCVRGAERAAHQRHAIARIFSRSALVRIGCATSSRLCVAGVVAQQVRPRPDHRDQRHHQLLADRIDRRVGDLGEVLLEVVVEQLRLARQHGERRVGAHRADRIVAVAAPSARGRTACPPGCSRTPAGCRSSVVGSFGRAAVWPARSGGSGSSSSLNCVAFSHSA